MNWINRRYVFVGFLCVVLINEFTLQILDKNPPLSDYATQAVRIFDFFVIFFALTAKYIIRYAYVLGTIFFYVMPSLLAIGVLDISLGLIGFGYPSHYEQENLERFPYPTDSFRGKPNVLDHNEFGFRGDFISSNDSFNVAIFGGSTTYSGNPPIIELARDKLVAQGININTFNFGSVSSNHSQHVHRLLDFSDQFNFDIVVFYGGGNETLQYSSYDPRPGYPYNFFYRNELNPLVKVLLRYSSLVGSIDVFTSGKISGLRKIRDTTLLADWPDRIVDNYWRDLSLANNIANHLVQPSYCTQVNFISILQPGNPNTELESKVWNSLLRSNETVTVDWNHIDLSSMNNQVEFTDIIHITQPSREIIADRLSKLIEEVYLEKCR